MCVPNQSIELDLALILKLRLVTPVHLNSNEFATFMSTAGNDFDTIFESEMFLSVFANGHLLSKWKASYLFMKEPKQSESDVRVLEEFLLGIDYKANRISQTR